MKKLIAFLISGLGLFGCAQADPDQYNMLNDPPVYGETNGVAYDRTNDYLSFFIDDTEIAYLDSSGNLSVDGTVDAQSLDPDDDDATCFGTGDDACFEFNAADMAPDSMVIGVGTDSRQLIIGESADVSGAAAADLAIAQQTNPTLNIHSADATDSADYVLMAHDQTNAVITPGQGSVQLAANAIVGIGTAATDYTVTFDGETNDCTLTCMEDEARFDVEGNLQFGTGTAATDYTLTADGEDADGNLTWMEDEDYWIFNDDVVLNGAAGSLQFLDGDETVTLKDNDSTAWSIDSSGTSSFVLADTTTDAEELNVNGTTATSAFRVDTGFATFDEQAVLTAGSTAAAAYVCTATAADCITLSGAAPTMTIKDNESAALVIKSSGAASFMTLDTTTDAEELNVAGTTATSSFRVDTGFATFDEQAVLTAGADVNGDLLCGGGTGAVTFDAQASILLTGTADNAAAGLSIGSTGDTDILEVDTEDAGPGITVNGTLNVLDSGSAGWDDGASGNQPCNTTCGGTGACLFGLDANTGVLVDCADATADSCICGGPSASS